MELDLVIGLLKKAQGGKNQKEFAEELGVSSQYLNDVYMKRREPGESILHPMGLVKVTSYQLASTQNSQRIPGLLPSKIRRDVDSGEGEQVVMSEAEDQLEKMAREFEMGAYLGNEFVLDRRVMAFARQIVQKCAEAMCSFCFVSLPEYRQIRNSGSSTKFWLHENDEHDEFCECSKIWEAFGTEGTGGGDD